MIFEYLKHCLQTSFYLLRFDSLKILKPYINIAFEEIQFDIAFKYSGKIKVNDEKELVELLQNDPTLEAIFLYRLERAIYLKEDNNEFLPILASYMRIRTGSEIYYSTDIGKGFNVQHGFGIVIGPRFKIGNNFTIHQGVTLGQKNLYSPDEVITVGNNVTIFAGASILGNINIGDNAKIGANSVVLTDIEENSVYAGVPAKRVK